MRGGVADEVEGDMAVDQAKQVVGRNQLFEGDHFQTVLVRGGRFEHAQNSNTKPPTRGGFVSSLQGAWHPVFAVASRDRGSFRIDDRLHF
jgi:hypothetical protein